MDDCVIYKCSVDILRYLPNNYNILMSGADFALLTFKVLFEPGKKQISNKVKNTIEDIKENNAGSLKQKYVKLTSEYLITLCDCKQIKNISILVNDKELFRQDITNKMISRLRRKKLSSDNILYILGMNSLEEVKQFILINNFTDDISKDIINLYNYNNDIKEDIKKPHL